MKISKDYFRELLDRTAANTAVSQIAQAFGTRAKLTEAESNVQLYMLYTGDVGNGGHSQFFENTDEGVRKTVHTALERMARSKVQPTQPNQQAFTSYAEKKLGKPTPADIEAHDRSVFAEMAAILAGATADLDAADKRLDAFFDADERILRYLRSNEETILREERDA